jgi:hypothetical protein
LHCGAAREFEGSQYLVTEFVDGGTLRNPGALLPALEKKRRRMSAATRRRMAAAQRRRWAKVRRAKKTQT